MSFALPVLFGYFMLCYVMQANNPGSESSTSHESTPRTGTRRRRLSTKALAQKKNGQKKLKQRRLSFPEGAALRSLADINTREGSGEAVASGNFLAMIANAAVAIDGLKRVRPPPCCMRRAFLPEGHPGLAKTGRWLHTEQQVGSIQVKHQTSGFQAAALRAEDVRYNL